MWKALRMSWQAEAYGIDFPNGYAGVALTRASGVCAAMDTFSLSRPVRKSYRPNAARFHQNARMLALLFESSSQIAPG